MLRRASSLFPIATAPTAPFFTAAAITPRFARFCSSTSTSTNSSENLLKKQQQLSPQQEEFLKNFRARLDAKKQNNNNNDDNDTTIDDPANPEKHFVDAAIEAGTFHLPCTPGGAAAAAMANRLRESGPTAPEVIQVPMVKRGKEPLPKWLRLAKPQGEAQARYNTLKKSMRGKRLATVCEEARCPNIGECWGGTDSTDKNHVHVPTATIMIMGDTCTRACRFCAVKTARIPPPLDPEEPNKTAKAIGEMGVPYIVITMVDRDDLADSGYNHVVKTIQAVKSQTSVLLECLVGDFQGSKEAVAAVANAGLEVYAHNVECVERITPRVRDRRANYRQSLSTLEHAKAANPTVLTKTSIMLGLGETSEEIRQTLRDLRTAGVDAVTLGQYLQPSRTRMKVERYVHPSEFDMWKAEADALGFVYCASGPMVRSSYRAGEYYMTNVIRARQQQAGGGGPAVQEAARLAEAAAKAASEVRAK